MKVSSQSWLQGSEKSEKEDELARMEFFRGSLTLSPSVKGRGWFSESSELPLEKRVVTSGGKMFSMMIFKFSKLQIRSHQISHSVVSNSLRSHELQHARPLCPSPTSGVHSNSRPSSW